MSTARARTHHIVTASAVAILSLLGVTLSACGSAEDPDEGATTSPAGPTDQASPSSAEPGAGWHTASDDGGEFSVPPDWDVEEGATGYELQAPRQREGGVRVGGGTFASRPTLDSSDAIDTAAEAALKFHKSGGMENVKRLPDATLGGVRFYHIRGENSAQWLDDYGTVNNSQLVTVLWLFNREMVDRKQTDEMLNQVMPTFKPAS